MVTPVHSVLWKYFTYEKFSRHFIYIVTNAWNILTEF